jgi:hypothetical protein
MRILVPEYFRFRLFTRAAATAVLLAAHLLLASPLRAQVSPDEIVNPELKAVEQKYLQQLKTLNREIAAATFPFSFFLSRQVGLDPSQQVEADSRGLEFTKFHERVVLKVTGNYNAAYNADLVTQNQRADRTFREVVIPLLGLLVKEIPSDVTCNAIGFEVAYHVRRQTKNTDFEGKEILVVVFDTPDAFGFSDLASDSDRQAALNRTEVYLNGKEFGLALGQAEPINLEARAKPVYEQAGPAIKAPDSSGVRGSVDRLPREFRIPGTGGDIARNGSVPPGTVEPETPAAGASSAKPPDTPAATQADADQLQTKYQTQLDVLGKEGAATFHFVDYAPPSFVVFRNRIYLQLTLRNPRIFDANAGSIYKRAAQSFDLFLAGQLKSLLEKVPEGAAVEGLDITVLNQFSAKPAGPSKAGASSEAVEFALPLKVLQPFVDADITNQQMLDGSFVLVNGVRIALNLQQVE